MYDAAALPIPWDLAVICMKRLPADLNAILILIFYF